MIRQQPLMKVSFVEDYDSFLSAPMDSASTYSASTSLDSASVGISALASDDGSDDDESDEIPKYPCSSVAETLPAIMDVPAAPVQADLDVEVPDYPEDDLGAADTKQLEQEVRAAEHQWATAKAAEGIAVAEANRKSKPMSKKGSKPHAPAQAFRIAKPTQREKMIRQIMHAEKAIVQVQGPSTDMPDEVCLDMAGKVLLEAAKLSKHTDVGIMKDEFKKLKNSPGFLTAVKQMLR